LGGGKIRSNAKKVGHSQKESATPGQNREHGRKQVDRADMQKKKEGGLRGKKNWRGIGKISKLWGNTRGVWNRGAKKGASKLKAARGKGFGPIFKVKDFSALGRGLSPPKLDRGPGQIGKIVKGGENILGEKKRGKESA